jgi:hypothetical protein
MILREGALLVRPCENVLASIRAEWTILGPLIDMGPAPVPQGSSTEGGLTVGSRRIERDQRSGA